MVKYVYVIDSFEYTDDHHYFPEGSSVEHVCSDEKTAYRKASEMFVDNMYESEYPKNIDEK